MSGKSNRLVRWFESFKHRKVFKKRYDVINWFARRRDARNYLEIGTATGRCLERVLIDHKIGVDPAPKEAMPEWNIQKMTSDAFFATNEQLFDIIFIDGLHWAEQVLRDIWNSAACLSPGGAILLHDCNPVTEQAASRDVSLADGNRWNGDTWKAIAYLRSHCPEVFCRVLDLDEGIGVVLPRAGQELPELTEELERDAARWFEQLSWTDLVADRAGLIGLISNREELEEHLREAKV